MSNTSSTSKGGYPGGTKIYRALITQTGTAAPVAAVLTNTFGGTLVWSRVNMGHYRVTLPRSFSSSKTMIMINNRASDGSLSLTSYLENNNSIRLDDGNGSDDTLLGVPIEIIVYP